MKRLALLVILLFACVTALAWTPLSLQRVETKQVKVYSDTGNTYPKTVEVINQVALQRMATQIEYAIKEMQAVLDSNFSKWGIDTVAALGSVTVTIGTTYESATSYSATLMKEINTALGLYCNTHTATTFVVNNPNNAEIIFRWHTIGRK